MAKSASKRKSNKGNKQPQKHQAKPKVQSSVAHTLPGISLADYVYSPAQDSVRDYNIDKKRNVRLAAPKVIVILEGVAIELHSDQKMGKVKGFFLLDGMKHKNEFRRKDDDGSDHRPDILHHCLLLLQRSAMNRLGLLAVYIRTKDSQLIEVSPELEVPPQYDQFEALMTNLLLKKTVKSVAPERGGRKTLMRYLKNDLEEVLPFGKQYYGLSVNGTLLEEGNMLDWVEAKFTSKVENDSSNTEVIQKEIQLHSKPIVMVVGAVAKSDPVTPELYTEAEMIKISEHALTASQCIVKILHAFESAWRLY